MIALFAFLLSASAATFSHTTPLPELAANSQAVVQGVVISAETRVKGHDLETHYVIAVEQTLRGATLETVEFTLPGGKFEGKTPRFTGIPLWSEGDEVIYFVPQQAGKDTAQRVLTVDGHQLIDSLERPEFPHTSDELKVVLRK